MLENTEKLFYADAYTKQFRARVISCEALGDGYAIILDRTAFYPEGGGQPADTGYICGIPVKDVRERGGIITHYTGACEKSLEVGAVVDCEINFIRRFSFMQHHSGEHIVSGLIKKALGFDNVGFHMGSEAVTIDFNGVLGAEDLWNIECLANEAVYRNLPIEASYPDKDALDGLSYRSKKELSGDVRIITVPEYDTCACCGIHNKSTGEIGIIKLVTAQSYKGGTRITMLCGSEALADYHKKNRNVYEISAKLSSKPNAVSEAVGALLEENTALKRQLWSLKNKLFNYKAAALEKEKGGRVCFFEDNLNANELRQFCMLLCERAEYTAVFSGTEETGYKYAIGSLSADVRIMGNELNAALNGRGGGAKGLTQGSIRAKAEEIKEFLAERDWQFYTHIGMDLKNGKSMPI